MAGAGGRWAGGIGAPAGGPEASARNPQHQQSPCSLLNTIVRGGVGQLRAKGWSSLLLGVLDAGCGTGPGPGASAWLPPWPGAGAKPKDPWAAAWGDWVPHAPLPQLPFGGSLQGLGLSFLAGLWEVSLSTWAFLLAPATALLLDGGIPASGTALGPGTRLTSPNRMCARGLVLGARADAATAACARPGALAWSLESLLWRTRAGSLARRLDGGRKLGGRGSALGLGSAVGLGSV